MYFAILIFQFMVSFVVLHALVRWTSFHYANYMTCEQEGHCNLRGMDHLCSRKVAEISIPATGTATLTLIGRWYIRSLQTHTLRATAADWYIYLLWSYIWDALKFTKKIKCTQSTVAYGMNYPSRLWSC